MLAFLLSKAGLTMIGVGLIAGVILIQTARLQHAKNDLAAARASLATAEASLKASEGNRTAEYARATSALSDAQNACSARVATALKSGAAIHRIVSKPAKADARGCPVREIVTAAELRGALQP